MRDRTPLLLLLALSLPAQVPELSTARLEGQLVDPMQQPVPGAMVVAELDGEPLGKTFTDAQGTFVFGRLPARIVVVRATTKTPDIGGNWVDLFGMQRGFVRIVTMPARKVAGIVRDDAGQPVAGAWVIAAPNDAIEFVHASCMAQSDANGRYELRHVPMGPVVVRAWAPGCDAFDGIVDGTADVALDPVVELDGGQEQRFTLAGATAEQLAAAELHVRAVLAVRGDPPFPLPGPLRRPQRGADGAWLVRGWARGDILRASIVLPGACVTPVTHAALASSGFCPREFRADDPEAAISGTLAAGAGPDLGGRLVLVQPLGEPVDNHNRFVALARPDGTFTVRAPVEKRERFALRVLDRSAVVDGSDPVSAMSSNQAGQRAWYIAAHVAATQHAVNVRKASRISLSVRAPDGTPAPGAAVSIHAARGKATMTPGLAVPLSAFGAPLAFASSDLDGHVEIVGLDLRDKEELACLVLHGQGFGEVTFQAGDRPDYELGLVQLAPAATLAGTCLDADDKPAAAARVMVGAQRAGPSTALRIAAGRDGRFVVTGLLPGNYAVVILTDQSTWQTVVLAEGINEVTLR